MKVTIHCEGSQKEVYAQLIEAAAVYSVAAPVATAAAAPTAKAEKAAAKPAKAAKKAVAPIEDEEEEFDLEDEDSEEEESDEDESEDEEESDEDSDDEDEEDAEPATSLQDVIGAFQKYAKKHSREKAAAVLKKYKAKSVRDLKPAQFGDVISALKK